MTFLAKSGEAYSENNSEIIGVYQVLLMPMIRIVPPLMMDRYVTIDNRELWIRYSPVEAVGIELGTQTLAATSLAAKVHQYQGDYHDGFAFYAASTLKEMPGITIDAHLGKDIEFGVGIIEGMSDASAIASLAVSSEAKNTVAWFKGEFGNFEIGAAHQLISVGGDSTSDDPYMEHWGQEYNHTMQNFYAKAKFGQFTPYLGHQSLSGKTT